MILFPTFRWTNWSSRMQSDQRKSRKQQISHSCFVSSAALHLLYCIVSIHLYSASCIAHQSEALPVLSSLIFYSFIQAVSIAPHQFHYYSEAFPTGHGYCVGVDTPKRHRQLRVNDLPKVLTWWLERD